MKIAESRIVGAMVAPRGKAAFDRAHVVVASTAAPGAYLQVRAYVGADEIEGKPLVVEDWMALVRSAQAIEVAPVEAVAGATFWVLRPGFDARDAAVEHLRTSGALLHDVVRLPDGSFGCLVNERDPAANALRDEWTAKAAGEALSWARSGHWERAREAASHAFVLERVMTPERIAMLSLTHAKCGNPTGADGYVEMAQRSRGADFAARVREKRVDLEQQIEDAAPASGVRSRFGQAIQRANGSAMSAGLGRLKRAG